MRLDDADQHFPAFVLQGRSGTQHGKRLANARRSTEIDAQLAARGATFLLIQLCKQCVGIGTKIGRRHDRSEKKVTNVKHYLVRRKNSVKIWALVPFLTS